MKYSAQCIEHFVSLEILKGIQVIVLSHRRRNENKPSPIYKGGKCQHLTLEQLVDSHPIYKPWVAPNSWFYCVSDTLMNEGGV